MTGPSAKAEQALRRDVIRNEQQSKLRPGDHEPSTMFAMANLDTGVTPSRVGKSHVSGSEQAVQYEAIPSGPWSSDYARLPDEPPLNYSIEAQEANGTPVEIAASLPATALISAVAGNGAECALAPTAVETSAPNSLISSASASQPESGDGVNSKSIARIPSPHPSFHRPTRRL
jgi:hypothetical protein